MSALSHASERIRDGASARVRWRRPPIGVHVSIADGLAEALPVAKRLGCDCAQIFIKNPRRWDAPELRASQIEAFQAALQETCIRPVVAHSSYLLNLASPDTASRSRSVNALIDESRRCEALGVDYLVVHPGASLTGTTNHGIGRIAASLNKTHKRTRDYRTTILLETTAGQGTSIGHRFEHLDAIRDRVSEPERLGFCLDTCHVFAAGYDFRSFDAYTELMGELDTVLGIADVKCIHFNDSKRDLGSRVDRHEHIGSGKIGKRGMAYFVNEQRFADVPMILETPKGETAKGTDLDMINLRRLRRLVH